MISFKPRNLLNIIFMVIVLSVMTSMAYAQDAEDEAEHDPAPATFDVAETKKAIFASQQKLATFIQQIFADLSKRIKDSAEKMSDASIVLTKERIRNAHTSTNDVADLATISQERAKSGILTDEIRKSLDEINYQVLEGYTKVPGVGHISQVNPNAYDHLRTIGTIYNLHVGLFCNPEGMASPPPGCGAMRNLVGIKGNENFVDFFLSERTWPTSAVQDTMQVAREYFFGATQRYSMEALKGSGGVPMIKWQRETAIQNVRIAILNMLAARRAPSSTATNEVLGVLFGNFASSGVPVTSVEYAAVCSSNTLRPIEAYVCNYTNQPEKDPTNPNAVVSTTRNISQAAIDRIMQYDYYMSPNFYSTINSTGMSTENGLGNMEVLMLAQQLTQDYYFLRMLQMKTVATALNSSVSLQ